MAHSPFDAGLYVREADHFFELALTQGRTAAEAACVLKIACREASGSLGFVARPDLLIDLAAKAILFNAKSGCLAPLRDVAEAYGNEIKSDFEKRQVDFFLFKSLISLVPRDGYEKALLENEITTLGLSPLNAVISAREKFWSGTNDEGRQSEIAWILATILELLTYCRYLLVSCGPQYMYVFSHSFEDGLSILRSACQKHNFPLHLTDRLPVW